MVTKTPTVPGVFTRQSSGLVRSVGTLDAVYYGVMAITIAYMVFIVAAIPNYVGVSAEWSILITSVGAVALGIVYALFASVYPRSGGEYVFLSRTVHPLVGFVISFEQTFWYAFYFGVNGAFFAIYGAAPLLTTLGLQLNSTGLQNVGTWFTSGWGMFLSGSAMVLLIGFAAYRGMGVYFRIQRWLGTIALGSVLLTILIFILGATGVLHFQSAYDSLAGHAGAYQSVIAGATKLGQPLSWSTQLGPTLNFMIWPAFALFFSVNMVSFSGEIKNVRRGELIGITGSMLVSAALMIALTYFARHAVGTNWLIAASTGGNALPISLAPYLNNFAAILANNPLITILISFWVIFVIPFALGSNVIYGSRALFAWGLDGVAPTRLGDVSERYHSPVVTIVVMAVAAEVALAIFAFTTWVAILSGLLGFVVAFLVVTLSGLAFPYQNRERFENSPAAIKVGGVPLLTIAAVVAVPYLVFLIWRTFVDTTYGAAATISIVVNIVVFAVAIVWFFAARAYRKSRGVDVDRRYAEIPVE